MIVYLENAICGLDFNPSGTLAASIDENGVCLISDVNTNDHSSDLKIDSNLGNLSNHLFLHNKILFSFGLQETITKFWV